MSKRKKNFDLFSLLFWLGFQYRWIPLKSLILIFFPKAPTFISNTFSLLLYENTKAKKISTGKATIPKDHKLDQI